MAYLLPTLDRIGQPRVIGLADIISLFSGEIILLYDKARLDVEQILQGTAVILATEALQANKNASADLPLDRGAVPRRLFRSREWASP
jgi:hypothetical protein